MWLEHSSHFFHGWSIFKHENKMQVSTYSQFCKTMDPWLLVMWKAVECFWERSDHVRHKRRLFSSEWMSNTDAIAKGIWWSSVQANGWSAYFGRWSCSYSIMFHYSKNQIQWSKEGTKDTAWEVLQNYELEKIHIFFFIFFYFNSLLTCNRLKFVHNTWGMLALCSNSGLWLITVCPHTNAAEWIYG